MILLPIIAFCDGVMVTKCDEIHGYLAQKCGKHVAKCRVVGGWVAVIPHVRYLSPKSTFGQIFALPLFHND